MTCYQPSPYMPPVTETEKRVVDLIGVVACVVLPLILPPMMLWSLR